MKWKVIRKHWLKQQSFMLGEENNSRKKQKSIIVMLFHLVWRINRLLLAMPVFLFKIYILKRLLSFWIVFRNRDMRPAKLTFFFQFLLTLKKITIYQEDSKLLLSWIIWDYKDKFIKEVNLKPKCQAQINNQTVLHHLKIVRAKAMLHLEKFHKWMEQTL